MEEKIRCWGTKNPLYQAYHDNEWGVQVHDDRTLFEFLILEGVQAGLSWEIVLNKRESYLKAFDNFDPVKVAAYTEKDFERLVGDSGIIRNKLKIRATITNAKRFLEVQEEYGSFDAYIWGFVNGEQIKHNYSSFVDIPTFIQEAEDMSIGLKKKGFKFVGPIICYSFMQAVGMVNDHLTSCFRYDEV